MKYIGVCGVALLVMVIGDYNVIVVEGEKGRSFVVSPKVCILGPPWRHDYVILDLLE